MALPANGTIEFCSGSSVSDSACCCLMTPLSLHLGTRPRKICTTPGEKQSLNMGAAAHSGALQHGM